MKTPIRFLTAACALAAALVLPVPAASAAGAVLYADHPDALPGRYVVVLKGQRASLDLAAFDVQATRAYTDALTGYAVTASPEAAAALAADPSVAYVAADLEIRTGGAGSATPAAPRVDPLSWGLDRIDQRGRELDNRYAARNTASAVRAFVVDTGIRYTHTEFEGRASHGFDSTGGSPGQDCNGRGTHVASLVGGRTTGAAKKVQLVSVRVFNCAGTGTSSGVLAGVDYITRTATADRKPSVAVVGASGPAYQPLVDAVTASTAAGVHYSVPLGETSDPAQGCAASPANTPRATTVGGTNVLDTRPRHYGYGPCADFFAPAEAVRGAWNSGDTAYVDYRGVSVAAGLTGGVAAVLRHAGGTADSVHSSLLSTATRLPVLNPVPGSATLLLYNGGTSPTWP